MQHLPPKELDLLGYARRRKTMLSKLFIPKPCLLKILFILLFVLICPAQYASAAQVQIAWNASTDAVVTGYKVYHGTAGRTYTSIEDAGLNLTYRIDNIPDAQPRYIAVTAYSADAESDFSEELTCYVIQAATPANGRILPAGSTVVTAGSAQSYSIVPASGYAIQDVLVDGVSVGAVSEYTFSSLGACHTISAVFRIDQSYTITAGVEGAGGTISPSGIMSAAAGSSTTYTITPAANYAVADVMVNGTSVGAVSSYTFSGISGNQTITAAFKPILYTVTASVQGSGGTISPAGSMSVVSGSNTTFTITPETNYKIYDVKVNGASVGAVASYTMTNITANQTITAVFVASGYTITASVVGDGTISPSGSVSVPVGTAKTFYIVPNSNNRIADVKVDGVSVGAVSSYRFRTVKANHTITATFQSLVYTITASAVGNGTITPAGAISVSRGTKQRFTISPAFNCKILDVQIDGVSVGAVSSYVFRNITSNHTIRAVFSTLQVAVADAGPDQTVSGGTRVTLNGSKSSHLAGIVSYKWVQLAGPRVVLNNPQRKICRFTVPSMAEPVALQFRLRAVSLTGQVVRDTCYVNVSATKTPPSAKTTADQVVAPYTIVTLDASNSTDTDDGVASYQWTQTAGPPVEIMNADTPYATFVAPEAGVSGCSLAFKLAVSDTVGLKTTDRALVSVREVNEPPLARAGGDHVVSGGARVVLNGTGSADPENRRLTYRWTQIRGIPVTLSDPLAAAPSFTAPNVTGGMELIFMVTVTDKGGLSATDKCIVTVNGPARVAAAQ